MIPLVLASTSASRKILLARITSRFIQAPPDCDESPLKNEAPRHLSERLAISKATSLASDFPAHLIIGSDQVAECENQLLGKPGTKGNAALQLQYCSGKTACFYTSLCLFNTVTGSIQSDVVITRVTFRHLNHQQIETYLDKEDVRFCAGSFKAESAGIQLFKNLTSDDPTALIGLPLIRLTDFLINENQINLIG